MNGYYYSFALLGLAIPAAIGALVTGSAWGALTGFLWGGCVRIFVVSQTISAINSFTHTFGSRPFATRDDHNRNLGIIAWLGWGEGWHNNYHAFPYSAVFGLNWYELDPGFLVIRVLEVLGLAWNVKVPSPEKIARRRLRPASGMVGDLDAG